MIGAAGAVALADALTMLEAWDNTVAPASRGGVLFERWWNRYTDAIEAAYDGDGDPQPFAEGWTPEAPTSTPRGLADLAIAETVAHFGAWDVAWGDVHRVRRGGVDVPVGGCAGALGCYRVLNFRTGGGSARPATRDYCDPCPCCSLFRCMSMLPRKYAPSAMATRGATMSPSTAPPARMSTFSEAAMLPLIAPMTINVLAKTSALILPVDPMVSV